MNQANNQRQNNNNNNQQRQQQGNRQRPRQRRNAQPVDQVGDEQAPVPQQQGFQGRPQNQNVNNNNQNQQRGGNPQRRTGLNASVGVPIPRGNPDAFKPKALTTTGSIEKDDPLILDAVLVDGMSGAISCARDRSFQLDYSQYIQIIKSSYHVMTRLDRSLQKYLSLSVYQYYCIVLLWKRLFFVRTERGEGVNEYEEFKRSLPPLAIPDEIGYYLDGIGNITDYNSRKYDLQLQDVLRIQQIIGIAGHYGVVNSVSHISYETLPSPFVSVYRILQDAAYTASRLVFPPMDMDPNWNLPHALRPEVDGLVPNRNLLGWDRATRLTTEQMAMIENANLRVEIEDGEISFNTDGVQNRHGIPIVYQMLLQTSELLSGSKSAFNNHTESTSYKGSMAQIGFNIRHHREIDVRYVPPISDSEATAHFYTQVSVHICCATSTFRYRVKRVVHGLHDSFCYLGPRGGAPAGWGENADDVYQSVEAWNAQEYRTVMISGLTTCDRYSERIRKIIV